MQSLQQSISYLPCFFTGDSSMSVLVCWAWSYKIKESMSFDQQWQGLQQGVLFLWQSPCPLPYSIVPAGYSLQLKNRGGQPPLPSLPSRWGWVSGCMRDAQFDQGMGSRGGPWQFCANVFPVEACSPFHWWWMKDFMDPSPVPVVELLPFLSERGGRYNISGKSYRTSVSKLFSPFLFWGTALQSVCCVCVCWMLFLCFPFPSFSKISLSPISWSTATWPHCSWTVMWSEVSWAGIFMQAMMCCDWLSFQLWS